MAGLKIWKAGERSEALCPKCEAWRPIVFQFRDVALRKSRVTARDVLVGVCKVCDSIATVPHQSTPKLQEVRKRETERFDVRVPKELKDVLGLLASEFGGFAESFSGGVVRYYLHELAAAPELATQIVNFARSSEAEGTSGGRLAFRAEAAVVEEAWAVARRAKAKDKSEMIRGLIVLAKHDVFVKPHERRRTAMRAIAYAVSE